MRLAHSVHANDRTLGMIHRIQAVQVEFGERAPVLCPKCGAWANRIRRRPVDRVVSIFGTVWRFRCSNAECKWRGTVRMKPMGLP